MTDKKKGAKKGDAAAAPKGRKKGVAATSAAMPQPNEVPRDAGDGEPPHGDPLRSAVTGEAFTGADRGATRHGEHPPRVGTIDSSAPASAPASVPAGVEPGLESGQGAAPVSTGGAPDPMMPDVWAPAQPD